MIQGIVLGGQRQEMALRALYKKGAAFRRHFLFRGASPQDASDLLQEVIIKIFKNAGGYRGSGGYGDGSANAWMWAIVRSCLQNYFRTRKKDPLPVDEPAIDSDINEEGIEQSEDIGQISHSPQSVDECVAIGLENFAAKEPDRVRVLEMQLDGMKISSIARLIGRTEGGTKEYLSQCKKKLAPYIAHCTALLQP